MSPVTEGATLTERYLATLARRSFLQLWSYPSVYRDQRATCRTEGKELCDLLVVFGDTVLIFSDKDCSFPEQADGELAWSRWYRRAIVKSAEQVWGAERWLKEHPTRVFSNPACTSRIPIDLPLSNTMRIHRIVVAHDSSGRRRRLTGGSGSLMINPSIIGDEHLRRTADGGHPFAIGNINPAKGFVHVFDDVSIGIVLRTLDTITDFVWYLEKKEALLASGRLVGAFGEEDLLAYYLKNANERHEHDFVLPAGSDPVLLEEGHWDNLLARPEFERKIAADQGSYLWDELIANISTHALAGSLLHASATGVSEQERGLRVLAREPRVRRRMLARALRERVLNPPPPGEISFRTILPSNAGDPHYVYVVATPERGLHGASAEYDGYRERRREIVTMYAVCAMAHYPDADLVVGIATEGGLGNGRSHDLVMLDRADWNDEMATDARAALDATGWFRNVHVSESVENEYPTMDKPDPRQRARRGRSIGRNDVCPCGSGKKYKRCHGSGRG